MGEADLNTKDFLRPEDGDRFFWKLQTPVAALVLPGFIARKTENVKWVKSLHLAHDLSTSPAANGGDHAAMDCLVVLGPLGRSGAVIRARILDATTHLA